MEQVALEKLARSVQTCQDVSTAAAARGWRYRDDQGAVQGPFPTEVMADWVGKGYIDPSRDVKCGEGAVWCPLRLITEHEHEPASALYLDPLVEHRAALTAVRQLMEVRPGVRAGVVGSELAAASRGAGVGVRWCA